MRKNWLKTVIINIGILVFTSSAVFAQCPADCTGRWQKITRNYYMPGKCIRGLKELETDCLVAGTIVTPYCNTREVALCGAPYTLVQDALNSIPAAVPTAVNPWAVLIYPGFYAETIIGRDYVDLIAMGPRGSVVITGTAGTLYTTPANESAVYSVCFRQEPTANGAECIQIDSGHHRFIDCCFRLDSDTNGITGNLVDMNGGDAVIRRCRFLYDMGGSAAGANWHNIIDVAGVSTLRLWGNRWDITWADIDDTVVGINEAAAATVEDRFYRNEIHMTAENVAYAGVCGFWYAHGAGADKHIDWNHLHLTSLGNGTAYAIYMNTTGNDGEIRCESNQIHVTDFNLNYHANMGPGDELISNFDAVIATDRTMGAGIFTYDYSPEDGDHEISRELGIGSRAVHYIEPTGVGADGTRINALITAADAGDCLVFMNGTYNIDVKITSNKMLEWEWKKGARFEQDDNVNDHMIELGADADYSWLHGYGTLDGESATQAAGYGINLLNGASTIKIEDIRIEDCYAGAINLTANNGNIEMTGLYIYDNAGYGVHFTALAPHTILNHCTIFNNGNDGIWADETDLVTVHDCKIMNNTGEGIYAQADASKWLVSDNRIYDNTVNGIQLASSAGDSPDYWMIQGNHIDDNGGWGILIDSATSVENKLVYNYYLANVNGGFSDSGTDTIIADDVQGGGFRLETDGPIDLYPANGVTVHGNLEVTGTTQAACVPTMTKTASYVVTTSDLGYSIRANSTADVVFSLPSMGADNDGCRITFVKCNTGRMTLDAADADKIADSGAGDTIYNDVATQTYSTITLEYAHLIVTWVVLGSHGTFTTTD